MLRKWTRSSNVVNIDLLWQFCEIGRVTSIENNHKPVGKAVKGQEVCIKIEPIPGDAPKLYGRHFDHTDLLFSKVNTTICNIVMSMP
jgi:translation initiation factor 5B